MSPVSKGLACLVLAGLGAQAWAAMEGESIYSRETEGEVSARVGPGPSPSPLPPYPNMVFTEPSLPASTCAVNGVYLRDGEASVCCAGGAPRVPVPPGCPSAGQAVVPLSNTMVQFAIAALSANLAIDTAANLESTGTSVDQARGMGIPLAPEGAPNYDPSLGQVLPRLSERSAGSAGSSAGGEVISFPGPVKNSSGYAGTVASRGTVSSRGDSAGAHLRSGSTGGAGASGVGTLGGGTASRDALASLGASERGKSENLGSEADSVAPAKGAGGPDRTQAGTLTSSDEGANGGDSPLTDYFERIGRGESIFKVVERRYTRKQRQWLEADANLFQKRKRIRIPMH